MKAAGLQSVNPSDPRLLALLNGDITDDELIAAAADTARVGKGWGYALATAEGRRRDAAAMAPLPAARPGSSGGAARAARMAEAVPGLTTPRRAGGEIIDTEARDVTA